MSHKISRRDFLKVLGTGAAATATLTGCGTARRYVKREPYTSMPEYTLPGTSTYYATTCRECPAACGMIVRTVEGRAVKAEGNPVHPVNQGGLCARGQASLQTLYNPDRLTGPKQQPQRGSGDFQDISWDEGIKVVQSALENTNPEEIAFLVGAAPDHLADLLGEIAAALGAPAPYRYGTLPLLEARRTLQKASSALFGKPNFPVFDISKSLVTFSFGANFTETWLSPVFYQRSYGKMRRGTPGQRGYLVQFEARMSQTGANADEWYPITPGSEALVAQALGALVAEAMGVAAEGPFAEVDIAAAAQASGLMEEDLHRLAKIFVEAERRVAIPGAAALGHTNGLEAAKMILGLNVVADAVGKPGGVYLLPPSAVKAAAEAMPFKSIVSLKNKMSRGRVKALFIHGVNPLFDLPAGLGFAKAIQNVPLVVSFASFADETATMADYILPDHTGLESWGYQRASTGGDRVALSSFQPVVVPVFDTRSTADVFLAAIQGMGGAIAEQIPYQDEVAFIKSRLEKLAGAEEGFYAAPEGNTLWARWLQVGGWWEKERDLLPPDVKQARSVLSKTAAQVPEAEFSGAGEAYPFYLVAYPSPNLGDGRAANNPWLQETPDPTTTVMWSSWIELNPETALELGVRDDDVVRVISPVGEVRAVVYVYPAIRPDTVAIPIGQGHTALGRYAKNRGCNPLQLLDIQSNAAGDLAFAATRVKIVPTGETYQLARMEDRVGVYGDRYGELYR